VLLETRNEHSLTSKLRHSQVQGGGKVGKLGRLHSRGSAAFVKLAAQNRKGIVLQGLTHLELVAKRSVSFRNFPKLSVSFRFVPELSETFRFVPLIFRPGPGGSRRTGWGGQGRRRGKLLQSRPAERILNAKGRAPIK